MNAPDPGARQSLRARLAGGPVLRAVAKADLRLYRRVRSAARPPASDVVAAYSRLGEHAACWLVMGAVGAVVDGHPAWRRGLKAVGFAYVLNVALKSVARRSRPALEDLPALIGTPTQLSFPSSHATASFAAARAYSEVLPPVPLYAAATAMAASRVYLGVHFPSDVTVGAGLGTLVGSVAR